MVQRVKCPEHYLSIGFTGTRDGMTAGQKNELARILSGLRERATWFHHGDCVGADAEADAIARRLGYKIAIHPPRDPKLRAFCAQPNDYVYDEEEYLKRNKTIVEHSFTLIATPKEPVIVWRSGTWSTIRYARKIEKPVYLIKP